MGRLVKSLDAALYKNETALRDHEKQEEKNEKKVAGTRPREAYAHA